MEERRYKWQEANIISNRKVETVLTPKITLLLYQVSPIKTTIFYLATELLLKYWTSLYVIFGKVTNNFFTNTLKGGNQ